MQKAATLIKNNLSEQLTLYRYMDRLTMEKKALIVKGDAESLSELDKHIEAVTCQILELEQSRLKILDSHHSKDSKLTDFIKTLDSKTAEPLVTLQDQLINTIKDIQKVNNLNVYLIRNSIKWIEHSVSTIANVIAPESAAYNARGKSLSSYNMSSPGIVEHDA